MSNIYPEDKLYGSYRGLPFKNDNFAEDTQPATANQVMQMRGSGMQGEGLGDIKRFCTKQSKKILGDMIAVAKNQRGVASLNKYDDSELRDAIDCAKFKEAANQAEKAFQKRQGGKGKFDRYLYNREASKSSKFTSGSTESGSYKTAIIPDREGVNRRYFFFSTDQGNILAVEAPRGVRGNSNNGRLITWAQGKAAGDSFLSKFSKSMIKQAYDEFKKQRGSGAPKRKPYGKDDHIEFGSNSKSMAVPSAPAQPTF